MDEHDISNDAAEQEEQVIPIALPERHWLVVLALLDGYVQQEVQPRIRDLQTSGKDLSEMTEEDAAMIADPLIARGIVIKALAEHGVIDAEADEQFGIDRLMEIAGEVGEAEGDEEEDLRS